MKQGLVSPLQTGSKNRFPLQVAASIAANAGSTLLAAVAVPVNCLAVIRARLFGAAGTLTPLAVVADADADTLTLVAHGLATGTPVFVVGGSQPGGVTATTVYYARAETADTITLYGTQAQSVTGGATGLVDITSAGSSVVVRPTVLNAVYFVDAAFRNRNGKVEIIGAINKVAMEDVAGWDCTMVANDTTDTFEVKVTPDTVLATRFEVIADVEISGINIG